MSNANILNLQDIKKLQPQLELLPVIPKSLAEKTQSLAFKQEEGTLSVLTTNNNPTLYHQIIDKLEAQGYTHITYFTNDAGFAHALSRYDTLEKQQQQDADEQAYKDHAVGEEAVKLIKQAYENIAEYSEGGFIDEILTFAYQSGASDVHFQAEEIGVVMRVRIDGVLQSVIVFSHESFQKYLMKLKYRSGVKMNISKTMQDGRFDFDIPRKHEVLRVDVRVSVMPGIRGESLVLRFLDASKGIMNFDQLGCEYYHKEILEKQLNRNFGLILVTGPTGSGKTTTVYSLLNHINHPSKKIITLEDPVEYELPGIEQSQINVKAGYDFETGLKGILRHDPDIIMVGEIRTLETAEMAVNAALTGHLVISTLHTNTATEAITRLLNMGVKPFMLSSSLNCIIGQRLLRKIAKPKTHTAPAYIDAEIKAVQEMMTQYYPQRKVPYEGIIYQPDKRTARINDGYKGRVAIYEMLEISAEIKQAILDHAATKEIFSLARTAGFATMKDNAYLKMLDQITSMEEIERIL